MSAPTSIKLQMPINLLFVKKVRVVPEGENKIPVSYQTLIAEMI